MRYDVRPAASGGWLALAAGPRLLVLPDLDDPATALASLEGADGFRRAVDLLAAGGLTAMPPFALVDTSGEARIIVRGDVVVTVEDAAGTRVIDAATVSTWVEQLVPGLLAVTVVIPGAERALDRALPLGHGAAWVAGIRAIPADDATGSVAPDAAPIAQPDDAVADAAPAAVSPSPIPVTAPAAPAAVAAAAAPVATPAPVPDPAAAADADPAPPTAADRIDAPPPVIAEPAVHDHDPHATVIGPFDSLAGDAAHPPAPVEAVPAADDGYDYLFGETVYRSVAEAAVPDDPADDAADPVVETTIEPAGDHDGETVLTTDIAKLRADRPRQSAPAPAPVAAVVPSVILPNGSHERLDQPIIIGRSPSASQVTAGSIPKLVTIGSGDQDISRSHVRLALEGGTVVVTDLHSVNGTTVVLPGREPQRLRAGESTAVIPGTLVDLGGGVVLTVVED